MCLGDSGKISGEETFLTGWSKQKNRGRSKQGHHSQQWPRSREIFQGSWRRVCIGVVGQVVKHLDCPAEELEVHIVSGVENSDADLGRSCTEGRGPSGGLHQQSESLSS